MIINAANVLSLCRIPLAFAFLQESLLIRVMAIILALITDGLDGYLARKRRLITSIGTVLDPLTDRFFVIFALTVLAKEAHLEGWKVFSLFSRDLAIFIFGIYLSLKGKRQLFEYRALLFGKITTTLQLVILSLLTFHVVIPNFVFALFIILGLFTFIELLQSNYKLKQT